ncbi:DEGP9 [Symbiodinium sp. CCMP2592]|nr:DEGP9 [Symbiodinium sp. CCMP2592]
MSSRPNIEVEELRRKIFDLEVLVQSLQDRIEVDQFGARANCEGPSWAEREDIAEGIGQFIKRALQGDYRGSSGRDRLKLASKYYLIFRDRDGLHTLKVRIETSFKAVKGCCFAEGKVADHTVFVGVPSLREARIVVREAGRRRSTNRLLGAMSGAPGSEESGGADEADGEAVQLQDFAIQIGEELGLDCPIGVLAVGDGSNSLTAALVGISLEGSFRKPVKFAVAACEGTEMQAKAGNQTIVVWLGYLTESLADFSDTHRATVGFGTAENPNLPFAAALVCPAEDKFRSRPGANASTVLGGEDLLKGLDPGVVASAKASGISTQSLAELAKVLAGPGKLEDMALAVTQLTKVVKHLAAEKKKPKNPLEQLLALNTAVSENPTYLYKTIEHNLREDLEGRTLGPGAGDGSGGSSIRGWLEHRSKINQYGTTRWSWILGGVWQSLIDGKVEEARARCALGVAAADQSAVDNSWMTETLWGVYLNHIKDLDAFQEARRRLSNKQEGGGDGETNGGKGSWQTDEKIEKPGKGHKTERPGRKGKDKGTGKGAAAPAHDA